MSRINVIGFFVVLICIVLLAIGLWLAGLPASAAVLIAVSVGLMFSVLCGEIYNAGVRRG